MSFNQEKPNYKVPHSGNHDKDGSPIMIPMDWHYEYEVSHTGLTHVKYANAQDSSNNFNARVGPMGEFEHWQRNSGNSIYTEMMPHARRHWDNNHSSHTKTNSEGFTGGVGNQNTKNERATTTTKNEMSGVTNNNVALHGNDARIRSSSNFVNASDSGIHIQTTGGDSYNYHEKDVASTYGGNHYEITQKDRGIHVQKDGNLDFRVQKGKMQLQTGKGDLTVKSGGNMMINASSKITIQVGGSTITLESGQVTIKSQKITLDGESHVGGQGGQLCGTCGGGCSTRVYVT